MANKELSIGIIGGGIGGLSAALSLLRAGADVHVYERARTISEVGAGRGASYRGRRDARGLPRADRHTGRP